MRDKTHLNPAAQAKKSLAKRRPALCVQYSCQLGSLVCGCVAGIAAPSWPGSLGKVRQLPMSEMSAADNDSGLAGRVFEVTVKLEGLVFSLLQ